MLANETAVNNSCIEKWRTVWRAAIAPHMSTTALEALALALETDDLRLLQGATTQPPPLSCVRDWPVESACVIGFCGWQEERLATVGEVEDYFAAKCTAIDSALREPAGCRHFLNYYDDTPRDTMRRELLGEVRRELERRDGIGF